MKQFVCTSQDLEMTRVWQIAENIAASRATILILGESGTGKEILARFIHARSGRSQHKMVAVNCAAIPENLLESELFGHEKGSFTGAVQTKIGKFELANNGTILLDEMSEMPLHLQAKLLRVIQEGEIERVGGNQIIKVNVRLVATSNRDLAKMVQEGKFRQDLYYRLNVIPIRIPALRTRPQDVRQLAMEFMRRSADKNKIPAKPITDGAWKKLLEWSWPGNVRELENVIERALLLSTNTTIVAEDLQGFEGESASAGEIRAGMTLHEMERQLIVKTLEMTSQNRTQAADVLGISVRTLRNKLAEYRSHQVVPEALLKQLPFDLVEEESA
jgi:two-component system response regulator FlrC